MKTLLILLEFAAFFNVINFFQIVKHLPKSGDIICSTVDRDCYKERAYLFIQNHSPLWVNTNMSAGREFCCKDNEPYKCK